LILYFDASALVKRYAREIGSALVRRLLGSSEVVATSRLSEIEVASAVTRRARAGAITSSDRDRILAAIDPDFASLVVVELTPAISGRARTLLQRHSLRGSDAVHLASGCYLRDELTQPIGFVCFDDRLTRTARTEGFEVEPRSR
jgi:predicted nucleic acid-binding protein